MARRRILVVDDEPGMTRLVSLYLRQADYAVETAATGADALHAVEQGPFDLVVLDIGLPDIDGYSVCQQIRSAGNVPIIMLTARSDYRDRIMGFERGADDYVPKPFNPEELVARVHAVLRRAQPEPEKPEHIAVDGLVVGLIDRARRLLCPLAQPPTASRLGWPDSSQGRGIRSPGARTGLERGPRPGAPLQRDGG